MNKKHSLEKSLIAHVVYRIIKSSFLGVDSEDRRCFRVKNLSDDEILEFLSYWELRSRDDGFSDIKVVVAADAGTQFPSKFCAEPDKSITFYRNNNAKGLVYLETKVESDEQGLKNIFSLQDRNFLDQSFDSHEFVVADEIAVEAWRLAGGNEDNRHELLLAQIVEVLANSRQFMQMPVRNFIRFALAVCMERVACNSTIDADETSAIVGRHLFEFGLFPDEDWRGQELTQRTIRRLNLNYLHADLVSSANQELDIPATQATIKRTTFLDREDVALKSEEQVYWKKICKNYCSAPDQNIRQEIPYRIFSQIFATDVKGLKLGERVEQEIENVAPDRCEEFAKLDVKKGLNNRFQDEARLFLDAEPGEGTVSQAPLKDLLTRPTRRMVEKVAYPTPERFNNPLIKLASVAKAFYDSDNSKEKGIVELRIKGKVPSDNPAVGLFAFIFGNTLKSLEEESALTSGGVIFSLDERLTEIVPPPPLKEEKRDEDLEELLWHSIPLDFYYTKDGKEINSDLNYEWLPDDYAYMALLWLMCAAEELPAPGAKLFLPEESSLDTWLGYVAGRITPFKSTVKESEINLLSNDPIIADIFSSKQQFNDSVIELGLDQQVISELLDSWQSQIAKAKIEWVPEGLVDPKLAFLLSMDTLSCNGGSSVFMLPTHPIRLRWLAAYLSESERLASRALAGDLNLNRQNDSLYLDWISDLSPHQQPPIYCDENRELLFAAGERGWTEEFTSLGSGPASYDTAMVDKAALLEIAKQVDAYLQAHPYKSDGLSVLVVLQRGGRLVADLIKEIRKGEWKDISIDVHVLAPDIIWEQVTDHFEKLPTENRVHKGNKLFPPLQLRLYSLGSVSTISDVLGDQKFDLAVVPRFLQDKVDPQPRTDDYSSRQGTFNTLYDNPTHVYGGSSGGEIAVTMLPRAPDPMLYDWSTLVVRHRQLSPISKQQPDNTDFVELRIDFQDTARLYEHLHKCAHWVVVLERYVTREQIETLEPSPDVLTVKDHVGEGGLYTIIVSSTTGRDFIISRLIRKLGKIAGHGDDEARTKLATRIYEDTRRIAPRLALQAMGISRVTEEILGLMVAIHLADHYHPVTAENVVVVWLSLDEHLDWFRGASGVRADLCRLVFERDEAGLTVDVLVVEGKLRQAYDAHGIEQVNQTLELFTDILEVGEKQPIDAKLWRENLLAAIENVNPEAREIRGQLQAEVEGERYSLPASLRDDFREGNFSLRLLDGLFAICNYSRDSDVTLERDSKTNVEVICSYKNQLLELVNLDQNVEKLVLPEPVTSGGETKTKPQEENGKPETEDPTKTGLEKIDASRTQDGLGIVELSNRYQKILDKFGEFGVKVRQPQDLDQRFVEGPASVLYRLLPGEAVDPKKLYEKAEVLKLALKLDSEQSIRFGNDKGFVTIDVPKSDEDRYFVNATDIWGKWTQPKDELAVPLGEDSLGNIVEINFSSSNSPHLLIGGTTGSGKSEALNTLLGGMTHFYGSTKLRLLLVDPKGTELRDYESLDHLEHPIGWDDSDAIGLLKLAVDEMQHRYQNLKDKRTRSLPEFNQLVDESERLPWWVIVLDEYADLTSDKDNKKEIESHLKRLAQKARAAGIHVIIATQKPSADVISTNLRSNLPAQLALKVKNATESRVVMDEAGAETLNGKGDAFLKANGKITRVQCAKI